MNMPPDWSLTVEDFGRIERAEVTVKPLTVLVGPNNSGKSYLGTLVWGIESGGLNNPRLGYEPLDALVAQWIARAEHSETPWVAWSDEEARAIRSHWNGYAREVLPELCRLLFDVEDLRPRGLDTSATGLDDTWYAMVERPLPTHAQRTRVIRFANEASIVTPSQPAIRASGAGLRDASLILRDDEPLTSGTIVDYLAGFSQRNLMAEYVGSAPVFLPAARTGFSLFHPTFLQATLTGTLTQRRGRAERTASTNGSPTSVSSRFTLPQVHLLSGLTFAFGGKRGPYADEADRLERECLDGTIVVRAETGVARYAFRPDGSSEDLGLQLSSAIVTELMPIVVLLRYAQDLPFLIVEEPEAHLHPKLQRAITRCLCRLARRGVRVLITTHSIMVAQQINNLVKLGAMEDERRTELQQRYGYGEHEYLRGNEVAVHEFRLQDDGRSTVERIECDVMGFPMPTFNVDLHLIAEETLTLNEVLEPEDED